MIYFALRLLQIIVFIYVIPSFFQKLASRCTHKKEQVDSSDVSDVILSSKSCKKKRKKSLSKEERVLQEKRKSTEERWIVKRERIAVKEKQNEETKRQNYVELSKEEKKARKIQEKIEIQERQRLEEEELAEKRIVVKERLRNERIKRLEEIKAEEERLLPETERKQKEWKEYEERTVEMVKKKLAEEDVATKRQKKNRLRKCKKRNSKKIEVEDKESKQVEWKMYDEIYPDADDKEEQQDISFEYFFDDSKSRTIWFLNKHTQERIQTELVGFPCPPWPGVTSGWDQALVEDGLTALERLFITEDVFRPVILPPYVEVSVWVLHCVMVLEKRLYSIDQNRWDYHRTKLLRKWFTDMKWYQDILSQITDDMDKYGVFNTHQSALYNCLKTRPGGIYQFYIISEFQSGRNRDFEDWNNETISNTYDVKFKTYRRTKFTNNTRITI